MIGEGRVFVGYVFYVVVVVYDVVCVVIDDFVIWFVELIGEVFFDYCEIDGVVNIYIEWVRGDFDVVGDEVFRVIRGFGVLLTELFDVFNLCVLSVYCVFIVSY